MKNHTSKFILAASIIFSLFAMKSSFGQNVTEEVDWRQSKELLDNYEKITNWFDANKIDKDYREIMSDKRFTREEVDFFIQKKRGELRFKLNRELIQRQWDHSKFVGIHKDQLDKFREQYQGITEADMPVIKAELVDLLATQKLEENFEHHDHGSKDHYHPGPMPIPEAAGDQCTNPDFELCNFTNWIQIIGAVSTANGPFSFNTPFTTTAFSTINALGVIPNEHSITTGGTDPNTGEPMVLPGGTCSVLLGDGYSGGADASRIVQTFLVDNQSKILSLNYHVVLADPNHTAAQQPYFRIRVTDQLGAVIQCASYEAYSGDGQAGWLPFSVGSSTFVSGYYLPWQTVLLPLTAYVGQNVTVEVTVGDCTLSGHSGYAYVDFNCNPLDFSLGGVAPCYGPYNLEVPPGAASYNWNTGDSTQSIVVTDTGYYSVNIIPVTGTGCQITVDTVIGGFPVFTADPLISDSLACQFDTVIVFADTSVTSYVHQWTLPNGSMITANSISLNGVTNADVGWYHLVTTDTASGCISDPDSVLLQVGAAPDVTVTDTTICPGLDAVLYAVGGDTYSWSNGVGPGNSITVTPGSTTGYVVFGYDPIGCYDIDTLTVNVLPAADVNVTPDSAICIGGSMVLNSTGAVTYTWDNGLPGNGNTQTVSPTTTTQYMVTGTDAAGCINSDSIIVTVNPLPIVDAGVDQFICEGFTALLAGSGAMTYIWDNGVVDNVGFIQVPSTVTYTVTGTDLNGCVATDDMDLTVYPNPTVDAGPDVVVCENVPVTLAGSGTVTYTWDNGVVDGVPFVQPPSVVLYTMTGTDVNNCQSTDTVLVTVNALPNVSAGLDTIICQFEPYSLFGSGAVTYTWDQGVTNGVPFFATSTLDYTVTGTDANGCQNTDMVNVVLENLPQVSFIADPLTGCVPSTVDFVNTTPGNLALCQWTFGDGSTAVGCDTVVNVYNVAGYFDVTLTTTSINGCVNSDTYNNYVYVEAMPVAAFSATPTEMTTLETEVEFTNNSTGASTYYWNFGDDIGSSTEFSPDYTYPTDYGGNYLAYLVAYNNLGCPDTSYLIIQVKEYIIMYVPNAFTPDGDQFNQTFMPVITSGVDQNDYRLSIFNRWGELLFTSEDVEIGWDGTYNGKLAQDGLYSWKIEYKVKDGEERKIETGHVNLLR